MNGLLFPMWIDMTLVGLGILGLAVVAIKNAWRQR